MVLGVGVERGGGAGRRGAPGGELARGEDKKRPAALPPRLPARESGAAGGGLDPFCAGASIRCLAQTEPGDLLRATA